MQTFSSTRLACIQHTEHFDTLTDHSVAVALRHALPHQASPLAITYLVPAGAVAPPHITPTHLPPAALPRTALHCGAQAAAGDCPLLLSVLVPRMSTLSWQQTSTAPATCPHAQQIMRYDPVHLPRSELPASVYSLCCHLHQCCATPLPAPCQQTLLSILRLPIPPGMAGGRKDS